jgi:hypothetical protein
MSSRANVEPTKQWEQPDDTVERLRTIASEVGFDITALAPFVIERMRLLDAHTETATDGTRMAGYARRVFVYLDRAEQERPWTSVERRTVVLACVFSDIGKTGPLRAPREGQALIAEMFSVEGVKDEKQSVATFLGTFFPADAADRMERFRALGLDPAMSMRAFWNHHASWTFEIVEAGGVLREAVAAAATHHFLDDVNPRGLVGADGRFDEPFGENVSFDRAEKLVIVLDKYDAARRRGACGHDAAIAWLRSWVDRRMRFRDDAELDAVLTVVGEALRDAPP